MREHLASATGLSLLRACYASSVSHAMDTDRDGMKGEERDVIRGIWDQNWSAESAFQSAIVVLVIRLPIPRLVLVRFRARYIVSWGGGLGGGPSGSV